AASRCFMGNGSPRCRGRLSWRPFRSASADPHQRLGRRAMQTWLVTGGAGFIGGNFVLDAMASGAGAGIRVINLDALTYAGNTDTLAPLSGNPDHVFVQGDIGDSALVESLLREHRPQAIINFAAESHVDRSIDGPAA